MSDNTGNVTRRALALTLTGAPAAALVAPAFAADSKAPAVSTQLRYSLDQPVVETRYGKVQGTRVNDVAIYLGMPYGASTSGENRFMPPKPPASWTGIRSALNFGLECPQYLSFARADPDTTPQNSYLLERDFMPHNAGEDCLAVNVWAPVQSGKRPVIVWMHGGGFLNGSGHNIPAYDGFNLANNHDVVVVSHNHRLNLFGYLDLSSFGGRWAQSANIGLQDLVAVLSWVRDNIEAFGGDPNNVTIFGHSGGGAKVSCLMAMPSARGLFHKAIVNSGSPRAFGSGLPGREQASRQAQEALKRIGVTAANLDRLTTMPLTELVGANGSPIDIAAMIGDFAEGRITQFPIELSWGPNIDGRILTEQPGDPTPSAQGHGVPLMVGTVLNELAAPIDNPRVNTFTEADLRSEAAKRFGAAGAKIVAAYRQSYPALPPLEVWCAIQAAPARDAALNQARNHAVTGAPAYSFIFAWRTPVLGGKIGTFHASELAFAFDNVERCAKLTGGGADALAMGRRMSEAYTSFARTGKPSAAGLPAWPEVGKDEATMIFDNDSKIVRGPEKTGRALLRAPIKR